MPAVMAPARPTLRQFQVKRLLGVSTPTLLKLVARGHLSEIRLPLGKPPHFGQVTCNACAIEAKDGLVESAYAYQFDGKETEHVRITTWIGRQTVCRVGR